MLHQGHISMKYFVKSVYGRKMRDCETATGRAPILRQLHLSADVLACLFCFLFLLLLLLLFLAQNFLLDCGVPCHAFTQAAHARGRCEAGEAGAAQRCCRQRRLHCCCFCFWQDVLLCGGGRASPGSPGVGARHKNYYRPNKRYFSRDECALVRVLFYFVELQPAS